MSKAIASANPARRATSPAPTTPAAGPETRIVAGCAAASSTEATPPADCITSGSGSPASRAPAASARRYRPATGARYASAAVVDARSYSRNSGATSCDATTWTPGCRRRSSAATASSCPGSRNEKSRQTATASASPTSGSVARSSGSSSPSGPEPAAHAVAALQRNQRLRMRLAEPVQMRARLPPQVQQMLEALVADERGAGAAPLEQRVRRDRRPVREPLDVLRPDRAHRGEDGLLLPRRRRHLRRPHAAAVEQHGVRERPADVDAEDRHAAYSASPCPFAPSSSTSTA